MTSRALRIALAVAAPLAVLAAAAVVRWHNIGDLSLWLDELTQVKVASAPLAEFLPGVRAHTAEAPLDLFGTRLALEVFGFGTVVARLWAFAMGVLAVGAVYGLTLDLTGSRRAALVAGALAVTSPILVYYAQESRPYSMSAAMVIVVLWAYARVSRTHAARDWLLFVVTAVAAVYTHYYAAIALLICGLAHVGGAAWRWFRAGRTRAAAKDAISASLPMVVSGVAVGAAFVPWYLYAAREHLGTFYNYPPVAALTPDSAFRMFQRLVTGAPIAVPDGGDPVIGTVFTWCLLLAAVIGMVVLLRTRPQPALALAVFALGLMPFVWWSDARYGYFVSARQLIFIAPVAYVLAAAGIAWLSTRLARLAEAGGDRSTTADAVGIGPGGIAATVATTVLAGGLVLASLPGLDRIYAGGFLPKEDWRGASAYAARYLCPGGRVYVNLGPLFAYGVTLYEPSLAPSTVSLQGDGLGEWVVDIMRRHDITERDVVVIFRERPGTFVRGKGDMTTVANYIWSIGLREHELFTPRLWVFHAQACPNAA